MQVIHIFVYIFVSISVLIQKLGSGLCYIKTFIFSASVEFASVAVLVRFDIMQIF